MTPGEGHEINGYDRQIAARGNSRQRVKTQWLGTGRNHMQ